MIHAWDAVRDAVRDYASGACDETTVKAVLDRHASELDTHIRLSGRTLHTISAGPSRGEAVAARIRRLA